MIIALCDRFKKLPSEIYAEPIELMRLVTLEAAMRDNSKMPNSPEIE